MEIEVPPVTLMLVIGIVCVDCPDTVMVVVPKIPDPSLAVTLTVTVPFATAVRSPVVLLITAYADPLVNDQVTALLVALEG